jgi:hypothetical protein
VGAYILLVCLPPLLRLRLAHAVHTGVLTSTALILHELVRARAGLVWILIHIWESSVGAHSVHCLVLLNGSAMHRPAALCVVHLRRCMHGRLLRVRRLLWWPLSVLLHVVLL